MADEAAGFTGADDHDRPMYGNRPAFQRAYMNVMATKERAERLRSLQQRAHAQVGRVYPSAEVDELVRSVLKPRG